MGGWGGTCGGHRSKTSTDEPGGSNGDYICEAINRSSNTSRHRIFILGMIGE